MSHPIKIGIIGGSGLNNPKILENSTEKEIDTPYGKPSDVLIEGTVKDVPCVLLARHGRQHNINPSNVNYRANIWALKKLGCTHVIVSTATGSLKEEIQPGDLVVIDSFIDRTHRRIQSFFDGSDLNPSVCHVPMEPAFCNKTRQILLDTAKDLGFKCHPSGTAVTIEGPRFSSKAESNLFRSWGAHLVNMTMVPEVILAKEAGLLYAAVAMATDYDSWRDKGEKVNVSSVLRIFKENIEKITALFIAAIPRIKSAQWTEEIESLKVCVKESIMSSNKGLNEIINIS